MMVRPALVVVVAAVILFVGCGSDASTVPAPAISTSIATLSPFTSPSASSTPDAIASTPDQQPLTAEALASSLLTSKTLVGRSTCRAWLWWWFKEAMWHSPKVSA